MDSQEKLNKKVKLTKTKARMLLLVIFLIIEIVFLYSLTYWGYHSNRLPYWFDNYIQQYGIWKIYGVKSYGPIKVGDLTLAVDPRIKEVANQTLITQTVKGYVRLVEVQDNKIKKIFLDTNGEDSLDITGDFLVNQIYLKDCSKYGNCSTGFFEEAALEEIKVGDWVEVEWQHFYLEDKTEKVIDKILVTHL